jgi:membrane protease YdiL (CAAX protease family)
MKQHPLTWFVVLAFLFSWWTWPLAVLGLPLFPPGPFLAGIAVLAITKGKRGVTDLLRGIVHWRVAPRWYALLFGLPLVLVGAAVGLNLLLGATTPSASELIGQSRLLLLFPLLLLIPGAGGAWSEPGWRGYALPRLLAGRSELVASLVLGMVVALWHLPLILTGRQPVADLPWLVVWSVMFTWIFKGTGGSVAIAMLFHAWDDTLVNFSKALFAGTDATQLAWLHAGVYILAAIAIVALAGPNLGRHPVVQPDSIAEPMAAIS